MNRCCKTKLIGHIYLVVDICIHRRWSKKPRNDVDRFPHHAFISTASSTNFNSTTISTNLQQTCKTLPNPNQFPTTPIPPVALLKLNDHYLTYPAQPLQQPYQHKALTPSQIPIPPPKPNQNQFNRKNALVSKNIHPPSQITGLVPRNRPHPLVRPRNPRLQSRHAQPLHPTYILRALAKRELGRGCA